MKALALFLGLFIAVSCASSYTDYDYQSSFAAWQQEHKRVYTVVDFVKRYLAFRKNMDMIKKHNDEGKHTFTLGLNSLSDLSNEEYRALLLFDIPTNTPASRDAPVFTGEGHMARAGSVDWRSSGAVQAVKNQGSCGSCWTFATAASIESITKIKTGVLPTLSEQNLLDCTPQGNSGCGGGVPYYAQKYVISNGGISTSDKYPYEGVQGSCRYNAANSGAKITGVTNVAQNSESALQAALNVQPVSIAIDAGLSSFQNYKSGTYNDATCSSTKLNHAVLAVGYGTDSTGDYYIVKNSWGTRWGNLGYINIARNAGNRCGVATNALFPTK